MEIKNSQKIDFLDAESIKKLDYGALQHRRYSSIEFKILKVDTGEKSITVQTIQGKSLSENYADLAKLIKLTKDLFSRYFPDFKIHVHAIPYSHPEVDQISTAEIRNYMEDKGLKIKDIEKLTGIDKTNLSAWLNDKRAMSQPVKAMFYFMIKSIDKIDPFAELSLRKTSKNNLINLGARDIVISSDKVDTRVTGEIILTTSEVTGGSKKNSTFFVDSTVQDTSDPWNGCQFANQSSKSQKPVENCNEFIFLFGVLDHNQPDLQASAHSSNRIAVKGSVICLDAKFDNIPTESSKTNKSGKEK
ncbi:helix-turn-helix transcriptional regulator [Chitinophaga sp. sic0106]|uniref:helix-turn-helix domain-containing protein n=1 Tax=Chitinophaga sp. sic0106 TaxID=2854785 RepID=UPI001C453387|nr:helix-turn-helix transcriptional regulator [Chitinophaga sp. sic0106]MBV7531248.1 helix-turn-helix transcriptional regulator [Chitinophaga sp. sic0106]